MASTSTAIFSLNAGEVSRLALARVDLAKLRIACEVESNFLPHVLGPAMFRPGTQYIAGINGDAAGWLGEFYFSETVTTLFVMTVAGMRFLVADAYLTRVAVTAAITNGTFPVNLAGWTDSDEAGAISAWGANVMSLIGTGVNYAWRDQQVTVTETGTEHALRVVILQAPVTLKVGTAAGDGNYVDALLRPGTYSLAFTPTGDFWVRFGNNLTYPAFVSSVSVEGAGIVTLPVPYAAADFGMIRTDQSADVVFVACAGYQQRRIERWAANSRSWGIALYQADDGPFRPPNSGETTITPSQTTGVCTLTATRPIFRSGHVGAIFRLTHSSQHASATLGALNAVTGNIRVSGLAAHSGNASLRPFSIIISGTFVATIALERSIGAPGSWTNVKTWTAPTSETYDDGLDNQIIYYRLKCSAYTSGAADSALLYDASTQSGIARVTAFTNTTVVTASILSEFGAAEATTDWEEGDWSDYREWPTAVALHDGRLFWAHELGMHGSVSDAFASFDDTVIGDAAPINRTIATGGRDGVRWLLSLQRLLAGTAGQEISIRASALDEPLTSAALTARPFSTRGAARLRALRLDQIAVYVERNGYRVFEAINDAAALDYRSHELTRLKQEMCQAGIVDLAVQRQPDTRVWFVLADGSCAVLTYDAEDEVRAWVPVTTDGLIERVAVLPGSDEDRVYFIVNRTISGTTKRYLEKLARRSEAQGGIYNKTVDCHALYTGAPTTTLTGLGHLEGKNVVVWAEGGPLVTTAAPVTVTAGVATLPHAVSNAVVGLAYTGQIKTAKLAYAAEHGTALEQQKRLSRVGLLMADCVPGAIGIGRDFTNVTRLPLTYRGKALTSGQVLLEYDAVPSSFNGGWDSDARACIQIASPHPCTIKGLVLHLTTNEPDVPEPAPRERT